MKNNLVFLVFLCSFLLNAQNNSSYWQQKVDYNMEVDIDVNNFKYTGIQKLVYTNNSPDVLKKVFYHLYFNAFQPGSEMDMRLQSIPDPDGRMVKNIGTESNPIVESRIAKLKPDEIGYLKVLSLRQNGKELRFSTVETVLEVTLNAPIKPGESVTFDMSFEGQVPVHIRRAGRNNKNGVALTMAQWYPKMAEYDFEGWHANPYIGREFHGVWGDFDVTLYIDRNYTVGGTGVLKNPQEIGHGYEDKSKELNISKGKKLKWNFVASKVHDFAWAADSNFKHDILKTKSGTELHFLYKNSAEYKQAWKEIQPYTEKALEYFNKNIGAYPWEQYSVIQAGDGGMEYAMCTFVEGGKTLKEIIGTIYHELAHAWFQHLLATNESKYSWMDEGFATYISNMASNSIIEKRDNSSEYGGYFYAVQSNLENPLITHSDRYNTNVAYGIGSYSKGSLFLTQLNYIIGEKNVKKALKKYYTDFKYKHPTPNDFKRIAEKISGIHLEWYLNEWTQTIHTIDYAVAKVSDKTITLARVGKMPMPIDLTVKYSDGTKESFYIPLQIMRGEKATDATLLKDWAWGKVNYTFSTYKNIKSVEIDPLKIMADVDRGNNVLEVKAM